MKLQVFNEEKVFMNTVITITVLSNLGTIPTREKIQNAFEKFDYVVKKYSRFDETSELNRINREAVKTTSVDQETFDLLKKVLDLALFSDGLYDPTIIDLLEAYGYSAKKDFSKLDNEQKTSSEVKSLLKSRPSFKAIKLDAKDMTVTFAPKQRIDFGSIGKGYAVELAANVLKKDFSNFLINAGGDVYAQGMNQEDKNWSVGLSMPENKDEIFGTINLQNAALCCSGSWAIKFKNFHHLINPKSGKPQDIVDLAFVYNQSPTSADVYATMLYLMGSEGVEKLEKEKIGALVLKKEQIFKNKYFPEIYFD